MNLCSIWPFAQFSDDFYYLDIWQCARYFVTGLFKELAFITISEMWGLVSRSRTSRSQSRFRHLWQSLSLVSKFEPGLGLGGYGLDYITVLQDIQSWSCPCSPLPGRWLNGCRFCAFDLRWPCSMETLETLLFSATGRVGGKFLLYSTDSVINLKF